MSEIVPPPRRIPFSMAAAALGMVVLVPALIATQHGFNGLYGQDSFAYVDYALGPLRDALWSLSPPPNFFWPPGYPLVVTLVALATGLDAQAGFVVSLFAGASVPILVALLTRELMPPSTTERARYFVPLLAGAVIGVAGQLWQSSVVAMSDTTALAAATLGAWALVRYSRTGDAWTIWLGAAAVAFSIEARLVYALSAVALAAVAALGILRVSRIDTARAFRHACVAGAVAILVAAPMLLPIGTALANGSPAPFLGQLEVHRWDLGNAWLSSIPTVDGRLSYALPMGAFYTLQPFQHYWFAALGVLAIAGVVDVVRGRDPIQLAVLVAWPALVVLFLVGDAYQNTRFYHAAAVPLAILVSLGAWVVWRLVSRAAGRRTHAAGRVLVVGLVFALVINVLLAAQFTEAFVERVTSDAANIRSLVARTPAGARIVTLGATALLRHDAAVDVVELYDLDETSINALVADGRATYVLVDDAAIHGQWQGRNPELALAALDAAHGMREIGRAGIWTLYAVVPI